MISIVHSGNIGDLIYSLPAMRQASRLHGEKISLFMHTGQKGQLSKDHPSGETTLSPLIAEMAVPLFELLDFIGLVTVTDEKPECDYDFDKFREVHPTYSGSISRWYFYAYPELTCDLSEPIFIPKTPNNKIVINRSPRYHGDGFDYLYLRPWQNEMIFVGLESEYKTLKAKLPAMEFYEVSNFLDMAKIITGAKLFIGNQSMAFALAEITKTKRILEVCKWAQNVIPMGANGYDCLDIMAMRNTIEFIFSGKPEELRAKLNGELKYPIFPAGLREFKKQNNAPDTNI